MHKLLRWAAIGALACSLMGCKSLHLYDSAADATATSAKADYDASKITDSIKLSRTVLDALDAKEIEAFRSVNLAERNAALLSLLSESGPSAPRTVRNGFVARFSEEVGARLAFLTGNNVDPSQVSNDLAAATIQLSSAVGAEKRARDALTAFNPAFALLPACNAEVGGLKDSADISKAVALLKKPDLKPQHAGLEPSWITHIKKVGEECTKLIQAQEALAKKRQDLGGQLGVAVKNTEAEGNLLKTLQKDSSDAAAQLKAAAKALADAQKAAKDAKAVEDLRCDLSRTAAPAQTSPAGATDPAAKKKELCEILAKLKGLEDFGLKVVSEERLAQINAILGALSGESPPPDNAKLEPGLVIISTSSRFAQAWAQYQQAGKLPALEPLLIDKELTSAQLAYAQSGVQLAESRVQYARAYEDATRLEVSLLVKAKAEIASLGTPPEPNTPCGKELTVFCASVSDLLNDKKLAKAAGNGGETANRRVYRALTYLSESYSVARDHQLVAELRLINTEYRVALSRSDASLASWNALLSVPVDQLKIYHAGGIKPQEAASLAAQVVQALAAVGIAVRID